LYRETLGELHAEVYKLHELAKGDIKGVTLRDILGSDSKTCGGVKVTARDRVRVRNIKRS
jgi:hypothetical protein